MHKQYTTLLTNDIALLSGLSKAISHGQHLHTGRQRPSQRHISRRARRGHTHRTRDDVPDGLGAVCCCERKRGMREEW